MIQMSEVGFLSSAAPSNPCRDWRTVLVYPAVNGKRLHVLRRSTWTQMSTSPTAVSVSRDSLSSLFRLVDRRMERSPPREGISPFPFRLASWNMSCRGALVGSNLSARLYHKNDASVSDFPRITPCRAFTSSTSCCRVRPILPVGSVRPVDVVCRSDPASSAHLPKH